MKTDGLDAPHPPHFESLEQTSDAAHLGMWLFLASELLLFAGLFALAASYRVHYPEAFGEGVLHNNRLLGTANTAVLLTSSLAAALAVHALREARARLASLLVSCTLALGLVFLAVKAFEYGAHFHEGVYPGAKGAFFTGDARGLASFFTLYFLMTGLHGIHVVVGMAVLGWMLVAMLRGRLLPPRTYPLALATLYWHLVDIIWIFLWPLFYLLPGTAR